MNVDAILLSEYATLTDGTILSVMKCFNQVVTSGVPVAMPMMCISMMIHAHHSESGSHHVAVVKLMNARRELIHEFPQEFTLNPRGAAPIPGVPIRQTLVYTLFQPVFNEAGPYAFEVYIDGTYHAATIFNVLLETR